MSDLMTEQDGQGAGVSVVRPDGRLDMQNAPAFREDLARLIREGRGRLVLDLEGVGFMDSSGLGAIISGLKAARQAGGDLRIARPTQQVKLVLNVTRLDRVLHPYDTVEQAVDGFEGEDDGDGASDRGAGPAGPRPGS